MNQAFQQPFCSFCHRVIGASLSRAAAGPLRIRTRPTATSRTAATSSLATTPRQDLVRQDLA